MRIEKVLMSVDDNPLYSDFWLPVSKVWKLRFGIDPVLIYFGQKDLDTTYGQVIKVDPVPGVPLYLQTQWARFWYTSMEPEVIFIVSDIDMFPISKEYFCKQLSEIDAEQYVHLNADVSPICVCYHIAKGKNFKKVLKLPDTFAESMQCLLRYDGDASTINSHMGFENWGLDEAFSTHKITEYKNKQELTFLSRKRSPTYGRIDRTHWYYDSRRLQAEEYYIDCHSLRPYSKYKKQIDRLVDMLVDK